MDDKWFKRQQKIAGVTADDIARAMGRDRSVVSRILNGHQRMTLDFAKAFAATLKVSLSTVIEKAGMADVPTARELAPGFAQSDAAQWVPQGHAESEPARAIAQALGADRPGVDVWRMKSAAMALQGVLSGDFLLVDSHAAERVRAGDTVVAQLHNNAAGTACTVVRRLEPPVLVAASCDPEDRRVLVVDGTNVVVRGKVIASWRT